MQCKHCHKKIDSHAKFCPECGQSLEAIIPNKAAFKSRFWFKTVIACGLVLGAFALYVGLMTSDPTETVEEQLEALRANQQSEAYYHYTSKTFQDAVSLGHFQEFVKQYPIFSKVEALKVLKTKFENNISAMEVLLIASDGTEMPVKYRLIKEGDQWKILSMKFEHEEAEEYSTANARAKNENTLEMAAQLQDPKVLNAPLKSEPFDTKPLLEVIQGQLEQLRQNNIEKAYSDYTSRSFKKSTSLEVFTNFIKSHPGFLEKGFLDLGQLSVENNTVTLGGTLKAADGLLYPIEYDIISEDGQWKILHIEILNHKQSTEMPLDTKQPLVFEKFALGTTIKNNGLVLNPSLNFKPDAGQLHLNVFIKNAVAGTKVIISFLHVDSNSNAPEIPATVPDDGDVVLSFAFSPPADGWPQGKYRIQAKSSTDVIGSVDFTVE